MITNATINNIYDKYTTLSADADLVLDRNLNELMMFAIDSEWMDFDGDRLTFTKGEGPLKSVEIERILGAQDLGSHMALVLANSVVFVDKKTGKVHVYLADID